jgi:hypothetical protein
MALKDSLNDNQPQGGVAGPSQTFTLSKEDVQFLAHINAYLQAQLDAIQQHMAASYLNRIAADKFGYAPGKDLRFNFDPTKDTDNLTIQEITEA